MTETVRGAGPAIRILLGLWFVAGTWCSTARSDDALVVPAGRFRLYTVPTWSAVDATYDGSGERHTIPPGSGRLSSFNLGWALEYGVNSWLTAGVQWTPGPNLSSSFDFPASDPAHRDEANVDDSFDVLAGVKIGLVGTRGGGPRRPAGLYPSEKVRLAIAFGLKFPVTTIDWDQEAQSFAQGRPYLAQAIDKHLVAPIASIYFDQILSRTPRGELFLNLYVQYIPYPSEAKYADTSLARHLDPSLAGVRIDYRYDLLAEVEPRFESWVAPRVLRVGLYVPFRYRVLPGMALDGVDQGNSGYRLTVFPALDLLSPVAGFPLELKVGYQWTLSGRNAASVESFLIVLRALL